MKDVPAGCGQCGDRNVKVATNIYLRMIVSHQMEVPDGCIQNVRLVMAWRGGLCLLRRGLIMLTMVVPL